MNIYSFPPFIAAAIVLFLGLFVFIKNHKSMLNFSFFLFTLSVSLWLLSYAIAYCVKGLFLEVFFTKLACTAVIFTAPTFFHFTISYLKLKKLHIVSIFLYLLMIVLAVLFIFTDWFLKLPHKYFWGVYSQAGPLHPYYLFLHFSILTASFAILIVFRIKNRKGISSLEKTKLNYAIIAYAVASLGGVDFIQKYGVNVYPFGFIFMMLFTAIMAYAIVRHRLMDIRVVVTRAGVFLVVYAFVVGFPFWLGYKLLGWGVWVLPFLILTALAVIGGPFAYRYLQRRIEDIVFKKERHHVEALTKSAEEILQIRKEIDTLLKKITDILNQIVNPVFVGVYAYHEKINTYSLKQQSFHGDYSFADKVPADSSLIEALFAEKEPVFIANLEGLDKLSIPQDALAIPCFAQDRLFGFILMGPKRDGTAYIGDEVKAFRRLSIQASLAIENCLFWQREQINEQIRRQKSMDNFSASMAHEIMNPVAVAVSTMEAMRLTVKEDWKESVSPDKIEYLQTRLNRTVHNLMRVNKMIDAVREFSRQTPGEFSVFKVEDAVESFSYMFEPQLKYKNITWEKEIEPDIYIHGNKIHLEEVLLNLGNNAVHAVENFGKADEGKISLKIYKDSKDTCLIVVKDSGYGIKPDLFEDIFLDFVTTKSSSIGTGMGLARVRRIVENHKGKIWVESKGEGQGASFFIRLPLAKE